MSKYNHIIGWTVFKIQDIFSFIKTESLSRNCLNYNSSEDSTYYIHYGDVHSKFNTYINFKNGNNIPVLESSFDSAKEYNYLQNGDLIIADASEDYDGVGACVEIANLEKRKAIGGLHTIVLRDKNDFTVDGYRPYILKNKKVALALKRIATGSKVYGISKTNLSKLEIPLPPLPEQQKIAQILTTWDRSIETIEKLIAKKQELKKGLVQQLLTGKKRFKEFVKSEKTKESKVGVVPEDWEVFLLQEITTLITNGFVGKVIEHYSEDEDSVLYFQGYNVEENSFKFSGIKRVSKQFNDRTKKSELKEGDLLTIQTGDVGLTTIVPKELEGSNCPALIISRYIDNECPPFYSQYFNSYIGRRRLQRIETGSTMKHLNVKDLMKWVVPSPSKFEQQKIASILSSDKEIEILQKQLEQLKEQKRGLMQKLLTGELRVNILCN
jgi:type I restriction enzyme S subunit